MAVNDSDLELLHAYLDSELPMSECEGLWRRLASEAQLRGELDHLREDHALRTMVWNSLEPDDSSVARLQAKLMRATRREDIMSWMSNALRIVGAAAALILFGFTVGWVGHNRYPGVPTISMPPTGSHVTASSGSPLPLTTKYAVEVHDRSGKLVVVLQFDSKEEAQQFVRDLSAQSAPPGGIDSISVPPLDKF
jgi:anti-sigma factor RsiW